MSQNLLQGISYFPNWIVFYFLKSRSPRPPQSASVHQELVKDARIRGRSLHHRPPPPVKKRPGKGGGGPGHHFIQSATKDRR